MTMYNDQNTLKIEPKTTNKHDTVHAHQYQVPTTWYIQGWGVQVNPQGGMYVLHPSLYFRETKGLICDK